MTTQTKPAFYARTPALWGLGLGLVALPFALPHAAQADDLKISLNFGNAPYSYHEPVVRRVVYEPAPVRKVVVVKRPPTKVVYVDKHRGRGHGHGHWKQARHDRYERGYERRVAYYY